MSKLIDLTGQKFARLTVLQRVENDKKQNSQWLCNCVCGNNIIVRGYHLKSGRIKSCGCLQKETGYMNKKHGMCETRLYKIWTGIKTRCTNKNEISYKRYGARNIKICAEWKDNFSSFYEWAINNGYADNLTIERINVNGNYEPHNCTWIPSEQQAQNRTTSKLINIDNTTHCLKEWARIYNIKYTCVTERIRRGWGVEKALKTPVRK